MSQALIPITDATAVNADGATPLHYLMSVQAAAGSAQASALAVAVRDLAERGVDVNGLSVSGVAPLHLAALQRNFCGASALLHQRAIDALKPSAAGDTAYAIAAQLQDAALCELIAINGGKPKSEPATPRSQRASPPRMQRAKGNTCALALHTLSLSHLHTHTPRTHRTYTMLAWLLPALTRRHSAAASRD